MAFVTLNRGIFVHLFFSMCHQSCALKMRKISRNQEFYHQKNFILLTKVHSIVTRANVEKAQKSVSRNEIKIALG